MAHKKIGGTKTEQNLIEAFKGESIARNKYSYFASKAKKEGYIQISKIFEETSNNEKEHAKIWFKIIDKIRKTEENLQKAIDTEYYEATKMYPQFAKEAKEEGFDEIAELFEQVALIEKEHHDRYKKLLENIENNNVFASNKEIEWQCINCGYVHKGLIAPKICPACSHGQEYFEIKAQNY